jgi:hypothetical protein
MPHPAPPCELSYVPVCAAPQWAEGSRSGRKMSTPFREIAPWVTYLTM